MPVALLTTTMRVSAVYSPAFTPQRLRRSITGTTRPRRLVMPSTQKSEPGIDVIVCMRTISWTVWMSSA